MILTNRFDPDIRVYKEAKYLVERGYNVEILCWDRESEYVEKETEFIDGIKIKRFFPYSKYGTGLNQIKPFYKFIQECKEYLNNEEYSYLHCHDLDGIIAGYLIKKENAKLIFDMHEFYEVNGKQQHIRLLFRQVVSFFQTKSDAIIHVNDEQTAVIKKKNKRKLINLPNYPEKDSYIGSEKKKSDKLRISYIGSVRQYEELKNLMMAVNNMDDVEVKIHGAGVAQEKLAADMSAYTNTKVTGKYHFDDSPRLYSETDILYVVYPSTIQNNTSYPIKFFEAIITQTPMIVNKGTVLEDFIDEYKVGFSIDGANVEDIRKLITEIKNNQTMLSEKESNVKKIQLKFSWDKVVNNLEKIYND